MIAALEFKSSITILLESGGLHPDSFVHFFGILRYNLFCNIRKIFAENIMVLACVSNTKTIICLPVITRSDCTCSSVSD